MANNDYMVKIDMKKMGFDMKWNANVKDFI